MGGLDDESSEGGKSGNGCKWRRALPGSVSMNEHFSGSRMHHAQVDWTSMAVAVGAEESREYREVVQIRLGIM